MTSDEPGDSRAFQIRGDLERSYPDVYTPEALAAIAALAPLNELRRALMSARIERRASRAHDRQRLAFLDPGLPIAGTGISVADARAGKFSGGGIPRDLRRQWIQGTGPATKPNQPVEKGIRNVAYALLSGADGWMFDGEDALGQVSTMSLDNQRNLKLAIARDDLFLQVAEQVAAEMNRWARGFFGRTIIEDWRRQLEFTTTIFRARGLHLDDRHVRMSDGSGLAATRRSTWPTTRSG
jgi:malate synthase